jgi:hypothetical protein
MWANETVKEQNSKDTTYGDNFLLNSQGGSRGMLIGKLVRKFGHIERKLQE